MGRYANDWEHSGGYLPWLQQRVKEPSLRQAIESATRGETQIAFAEYDWSLNTQAAAGLSARKTVDFGSGTIPNRYCLIFGGEGLASQPLTYATR